MGRIALIAEEMGRPQDARMVAARLAEASQVCVRERVPYPTTCTFGSERVHSYARKAGGWGDARENTEYGLSTRRSSWVSKVFGTYIAETYIVVVLG